MCLNATVHRRGLGKEQESNTEHGTQSLVCGKERWKRTEKWRKEGRKSEGRRKERKKEIGKKEIGKKGGSRKERRNE